MSDPIPPLDPELLDVLRGDEPAPAQVRSRARERLLTAVAPLGAGGAANAGRSATRFGMLGAPGTALVAFLVGGAVGAGLYAALVPAPAPRVVYVDRPVLVPSSPPPPAPVPTANEASPASPSGDPPPAASMPPAVRALLRTSQLSAERKLLDQARASLAQGDAPGALERLDHHRRTFPVPLLGEERDAMWIQALVKAGRYDEARARADAFRRRSPDSLFTSAVDSAIESIP